MKNFFGILFLILGLTPVFSDAQFPYITTTSATSTSTIVGPLNVIGSSGLTVLQNGNVGIGTNLPSEKLEVRNTSSGASTYPILVSNLSDTAGTAAGIKFSPSSTGVGIRYAAIEGIQKGSNYVDLAFITGSGPIITEKMRILANGNVGIGTSSPLSKLHVSKIGNGLIAKFMDSTSGGGSGQGLHILVNSTVNGTSEPYLTSLTSTGYTTGAMSFGNGNTEAMRLTATGNVGIGTTKPNAKLDVVGDIKFSGSLISDGDICIGKCQ